MTLDLTKPLQTRDGREARFIEYSPGDGFLWFNIKNVGGWIACKAWADGMFNATGAPSPCDIINTPSVLFVNVYVMNNGKFYPGECDETPEQARKMASSNAVAIAVPFPFTEGYGK